MEVSHQDIRPGEPVPSPLALRFEGGSGGGPHHADPLRAIASGEIDVASAPAMHAQITEARRRRGTNAVVLDLAAVQFMDSSALRVIVQLQRELADEHGGLVLLGPHGDVQHILSLTGLDRYLSIAETLDEARALLAGGASPPAESL